MVAEPEVEAKGTVTSALLAAGRKSFVMSRSRSRLSVRVSSVNILRTDISGCHPGPWPPSDYLCGNEKNAPLLRVNTVRHRSQQPWCH